MGKPNPSTPKTTKKKTTTTAKTTRRKSTTTTTPKTKRKSTGKAVTPKTTKRKSTTTTTPKTKRKSTTTTPTTRRRSTKGTTTPRKSTPTTKRRKSPKRTPKREPEPIVVEKPKRRLPQVPPEEEVYWKDWKKIFLVGTEWENYDAIYDIDWDFDHLCEDLTEGYLSESPNTKYVFGTTESFEMAPDPEKPDSKEVYLFPVITVVDSIVPPPAKVGITSVQRGEELKPMSDLKMEWTPYYPRDIARIRGKPICYFLDCHQRRTNIENLSVDSQKEYEYAIPYIWFPKNDLNKDYDTDVHIIHEVGGRGLNFSFDWEFDELDEMVGELLTKDEQEKHSDELKELIKEKVRERKKQIREEKEAIKSKVASLSEKEKKSLDTLKCYKYYPQNEHYPIERTSFINRYYGHAAKVFPPVQDAIDYSFLKEIITTDKLPTGTTASEE